MSARSAAASAGASIRALGRGDDLTELQAASDVEVENAARRRRYSATGTSVWEAWAEELRVLAPLPILPVPFDHVATRRVADDALICFEGRQYSVPFAFLGREVEVRCNPLTIRTTWG